MSCAPTLTFDRVMSWGSNTYDFSNGADITVNPTVFEAYTIEVESNAIMMRTEEGLHRYNLNDRPNTLRLSFEITEKSPMATAFSYNHIIGEYFTFTDVLGNAFTGCMLDHARGGYSETILPTKQGIRKHTFHIVCARASQAGMNSVTFTSGVNAYEMPSEVVEVQGLTNSGVMTANLFTPAGKSPRIRISVDELSNTEAMKLTQVRFYENLAITSPNLTYAFYDLDHASFSLKWNEQFSTWSLSGLILNLE